MKPEFQQYVKGPRGDALRFRISEIERTELEKIAKVEEDTLTGLLIEGVWRVIQDRRQDPEYAALAERATQLQEELAEVRERLKNGPSAPTN